jgi:hypothetical protein
MSGDDRMRHCGECKLDVYDLSAMSRAEAEAFIAKPRKAGRLCVRFQRRADGRIVTNDCVTARQKIARRAKRIRIAAAALFAMAFPTLSVGCGQPPRMGGIAPAPPADPQPAPPEHPIMGDMVCPAPQTPPEDQPQVVPEMGRVKMGEMHIPEPVPQTPVDCEKPVAPAK